MLSTIARPFGILLLWLYDVFQNYGVAIIVFALIVKVIFLPFFAKSKKSTMRASRLTPKLKELEKKHGGNRQKYSEEVQKLYREERVNPMSGCLWTLLPFPILIALYEAIRYPITTTMGVASELLAEGGALYNFIYNTLGFETGVNAAYRQIAESQFITQNWAEHRDEFLAISDRLTNIDWTFLGMDLGAQPEWNFIVNSGFSGIAEKPAEFGLFLIPVIAAILTYFSSYIGMKMNPAQSTEDQTQSSMKSMTVMMPFITLWFAYTVPAALGLYWIANSAFGIVQDIILTKIFKKQLAAEDAERAERDRIRAAELEEKRLETERLRAANETEINPNTSKRKKQRKERAEQEERIAEWEKKQNPKKNNGGEENPSRVGNRPYARGRAYDPNRFGGGTDAADDNVKAVPENASEPNVDDTEAGASENDTNGEEK